MTWWIALEKQATILARILRELTACHDVTNSSWAPWGRMFAGDVPVFLFQISRAVEASFCKSEMNQLVEVSTRLLLVFLFHITVRFQFIPFQSFPFSLIHIRKCIAGIALFCQQGHVGCPRAGEEHQSPQAGIRLNGNLQLAVLGFHREVSQNRERPGRLHPVSSHRMIFHLNIWRWWSQWSPFLFRPFVCLGVIEPTGIHLCRHSHARTPSNQARCLELLELLTEEATANC